VFTGADRGRCAHLDGRSRTLNGRRLHRTRLALCEIRGCYPKGYADGREAKGGIGEYFAFYDEQRLHQALGYRTPMAAWRGGAAPRS
jgi:putative transposase